MLDDVQCTGSENKLLACSSAPMLHVSSNCDDFNDAGVRCEGTNTYIYTVTLGSVQIACLLICGHQCYSEMCFHCKTCSQTHCIGDVCPCSLSHKRLT